MKKCTKCGKTYPDDFGFCSACGLPLVIDEVAAEVKENVAEAAEDVQAAATEAVETAQTEASQAVETVQSEAVKTVENAQTAATQTVENVQAQAAAAGAQVKPVAANIAEKAKGLTKQAKMLLCGIAGVIVVVLLAIIIASLSGKSGNSIMVNRNALTMLENSEDEVYCFVNGYGKSVKIKDFEGEFYSLLSSTDGSVIIGKDDENYYAVSIKGAVKLADYLNYAAISGDNSTVAFITGNNDDNTLYLINLKSKKKTKIASEVSNTVLSVSLKGKAVAYIKDDMLYVSTGSGNATKIAGKSTPLAVSDNGKMLYYIDSNETETLKLYNGKDKLKISDTVDRKMYVVNSTLSQVIYTTYEDGEYKTFLSENGKKHNQLAKGQMTQALAEAACSLDNNVIVVNAKDLKGTVLTINNCIYYLKNAKTATKVLNLDSFLGGVLPVNGLRSIVYIKNDEITLIPNLANPDKTKVLADLSKTDYDGVYISNDGKHIYFEEGSDLFYIKAGSKKIKTIATGVEVEFFDFDNGTIYYRDEDADDIFTLLASKNGSRGAKLLKNVSSVNVNSSLYGVVERENKVDDTTYDIFVLNNKKAINVKFIAD